MSETQKNQQEEVVSLNEDAKAHKHDDKSFGKLMNEQAALQGNKQDTSETSK